MSAKIWPLNGPDFTNCTFKHLEHTFKRQYLKIIIPGMCDIPSDPIRNWKTFQMLCVQAVRLVEFHWAPNARYVKLLCKWNPRRSTRRPLYTKHEDEQEYLMQRRGCLITAWPWLLLAKPTLCTKKLIWFKPFMFSLRKHFLLLSYDDIRVCNFHKDASRVLTVSEIYPYYLPTPSLFTTEGESEI